MANTKDTKTVGVILDMEFYNEIKALADKQERNLSWIIRKALQNYLENNKDD
jgi:predicted transcriptional regulator